MLQIPKSVAYAPDATGQSSSSEDGSPRPAQRTIAIYLPNLSGGGVERMRLILAEEFLKYGFRVTLLLSVLSGELRDVIPAGVGVFELGGGRTLADLLPLARYIRRAKPDILLSSLDHNNIAALIANLLARVTTKTVICQHNALSSEAAMSPSWKYRLMPLAYRLLGGFASGIVAVSRGVADDLARISHLPRERISVIYNPVIDQKFAARLGEEAVHPWFEGNSLDVFVAVGRLTGQKDFSTLLHAFQLYVKQRIAAGSHSARLVIIGSGVLLTTLSEEAKELGISDLVQFLQYQHNPLPFMRRAAAVVLSSQYEGFGNVLVEALGCGTPVISTDCPHGPSEILEGGEYGILVPVADPVAMAGAMEESLRRDWARDRLRARASFFSVEASCDAYLRLFEQVAPV